MAKKKTAAKSEPTTTKKKAPATTAKTAEPKASTTKTATTTKASTTKTAARSSKSTSTTSSAMPMVDTDLAAQAAAQMLAAGLGRRDQNAQSDEDKREGSLIRQLKADLNKGHAQTVSNVLDKGAPQGTKRSGADLPFGQKQVGRNQTFGADVTRSGVPRRTSG